MTRALPSALQRFCLTLLSVLAMMVGSWAQAAMPITGALSEMVICSEGAMRTVWLDAAGTERPAPHECRDCPSCDLPRLDAPAHALRLIPPAHRIMLADIPSAQVPVLRRHLWRPPLRGPPLFTPRFGSLAAFLSDGGHRIGTNARTVPA